MECGKHAVIEVPAAMSMDEIWMLIDTSEKTRKHCMMLENCIYDQFELTALNMAQKGLFGEILMFKVDIFTICLIVIGLSASVIGESPIISFIVETYILLTV